MKVLFAASEVAPFAKTGGLADVAGSLPAALARLGAEVTVVMPLYRSAMRAAPERLPWGPGELTVPHGPYRVRVGLERPAEDGPVETVFVRYDPFFDRDQLYGKGGEDYPDNLQRFSLFSRAVVELSALRGRRPDVFHLNDWQTSLVAALLGNEDAPAVLTIHNIGYQGIFWKWDLPWTGLGWEHFTADRFEYFDSINLLKGGIAFADAITTVSPAYAEEIRSSAEFGCGLEGVLAQRAEDLTGIVNGVDTSVWNPESDPHLPANFSAARPAGKARCKSALQKEYGLPEAAGAPLFGAIGRLAEQKGTKLSIAAAEALIGETPDCQFVFLGSGDADYERALANLAKTFPANVGVRVGFDEGLAHRIEAGADFFLMPSRYEPCGLNQLYSMLYGTAPIVRRTGGLADTVEDAPDAEDGTGTGFVFGEFSAEALAEACRRAMRRFGDKKTWKKLVTRAMSRDWSWDRSAREYLAIYENLSKTGPS